MNKGLLVLALALAGAALVVALGSRIRSTSVPLEPRADIEALRTVIDEIPKLRDDVIALRSNVAELNRTLTSERTIATGGHPTSSTAVSRSHDGIAASEAQVAELKETIDQLRGGLVQRGLLPPGSNEVHSLKAVVLDPGKGWQEKLTALRALRTADARSDDVVKQMIQVYYSTENPDVRADIFRQLDGVTTVELKAPLLEAVSKSPDAEVREEAAETLFHYLPAADVKAWLEHLAANDPNPRVREQAAQSLRPREP